MNQPVTADNEPKPLSLATGDTIQFILHSETAVIGKLDLLRIIGDDGSQPPTAEIELTSLSGTAATQQVSPGDRWILLDAAGRPWIIINIIHITNDGWLRLTSQDIYGQEPAVSPEQPYAWISTTGPELPPSS